MKYSKGIALILAFYPYFGLPGLDKYYTGNYTIGLIQTFFCSTFMGLAVAAVLNILTIISLLILIFTKYNLLFYVTWEDETTIFDYSVGVSILLYIIIKYKSLIVSIK